MYFVNFQSIFSSLPEHSLSQQFSTHIIINNSLHCLRPLTLILPSTNPFLSTYTMDGIHCSFKITNQTSNILFSQTKQPSNEVLNQRILTSLFITYITAFPKIHKSLIQPPHPPNSINRYPPTRYPHIFTNSLRHILNA